MDDAVSVGLRHWCISNLWLNLWSNSARLSLQGEPQKGNRKDERVITKSLPVTPTLCIHWDSPQEGEGGGPSHMGCLRPICHTFQQVASGGTIKKGTSRRRRNVDQRAEEDFECPQTEWRPEPKPKSQHPVCCTLYPVPCTLCPVPVPGQLLGSGRRCFVEFSGMPCGRYGAWGISFRFALFLSTASLPVVAILVVGQLWLSFLSEKLCKSVLF